MSKEGDVSKYYHGGDCSMVCTLFRTDYSGSRAGNFKREPSLQKRRDNSAKEANVL